jgi:broad specificity phosphatase PhoE
MEYYKYIKYKTKYMILQQKYSTINTPINIIICGTHGMRMSCFLKSLIPDLPNKIIKNCSIIRCYKENGNTLLKMIYEGEGHNSIMGEWKMDDINKYINRPISISIPDNFELFFIRHGKGKHNGINIVQRLTTDLTDAMLVADGISQAERAGGFLAGYINNYTNVKIFYEASMLRRTIQTIAIIMKKMKLNKSICIVPCVNELPYHGGGQCDKSIINDIGNKIFQENKSVCVDNNICTIDGLNADVKWDYFMEFKKTGKCDSTNMINEMLNCYNFFNNNIVP